MFIRITQAKESVRREKYTGIVKWGNKNEGRQSPFFSNGIPMPLVQDMAGEAVKASVPGFDLLVTKEPWLTMFFMWSLRILWFPAPMCHLDLVSKLH